MEGRRALRPKFREPLARSIARRPVAAILQRHTLPLRLSMATVACAAVLSAVRTVSDGVASDRCRGDGHNHTKQLEEEIAAPSRWSNPVREERHSYPCSGGDSEPSLEGRLH